MKWFRKSHLPYIHERLMWNVDVQCTLWLVESFRGSSESSLKTLLTWITRKNTPNISPSPVSLSSSVCDSDATLTSLSSSSPKQERGNHNILIDSWYFLLRKNYITKSINKRLCPSLGNVTLTMSSYNSIFNNFSSFEKKESMNDCCMDDHMLLWSRVCSQYLPLAG